MLQDPEDGVGAVFDGGWERKFRRPAVVYGYHEGVALLDDCAAPARIVGGIPDREATAMEVYENGVAPGGGGDGRSVWFSAGCIKWWGIEKEVDITACRRERGGDRSCEEGCGGRRGAEVVQRHARGHKAAPEKGLAVEHPS